ncbi:MAG: hypothetical protein ACI9KA_001065 [Parasphingorhabdus sp.]|jgi:hypothetical protein|uniref:hypothetical protein n=1 Tax=Parasphingorhabdus sp. TaxID=2709688 RepID=UPI0039E54DFC
MTIEKRPWEVVANPSYFRKILGNMVDLGFGPKASGGALIRFGVTGIGHSPHYQIELPNKSIVCFNGLNHKEAAIDGEEFANRNLSVEQFNYQQVETMLARIK